MDLHAIANSGSYGSGKKARDEMAEKAERRQNIPPREEMNRLVIKDYPDALVASFGYDSESDSDVHVNSDGEAAIVSDSGPMVEAKAIVALWNAYRDGDLVWSEGRP